MIDSVPRLAGPYTGAGQTQFSFGFKIFEESDVYVTTAGSGDSFQTTSLEYGTDFTVTMNSDQDATPGGYVVLANALEDGEVLAIGSAIDYTQEVQLTNFSRFPPSIINEALDRVVAMIQQLAEKLGRAFCVPETSNISSSDLIDKIFEAAENVEYYTHDLPHIVANTNTLAGSDYGDGFYAVGGEGANLVVKAEEMAAFRAAFDELIQADVDAKSYAESASSSASDAAESATAAASSASAASTSASDAASSASAASTSAANAASSASAASTSATNAASSASAASTSASSAAASASAASTSATKAATSESNAAKSATSAANSASAASASATSAASSESSASASASNAAASTSEAAESAKSAQSSADTAQTSATKAQTSATAASTSATSAAKSASNAAASESDAEESAEAVAEMLAELQALRDALETPEDMYDAFVNPQDYVALFEAALAA